MLAVIVLNWNGGEDLSTCLKSVYASEACGTEVVVYVPDNASTDGSYQTAQREFPQARPIQNGGNLGFSGGNNPGWRQAINDGAEWIFFLNNDAVVAPDCLKRMLAVCRDNPKIGAASPRIFRGTPKTNPHGESVWFEKGICDFSLFCPIDHVAATEAERTSVWFETAICTGCGFLTTAKILEETGGFDEGFFAYYEDVDLSLKIQSKGLTCAVVPGAKAWHKVSQSTKHEVSPSEAFYCWRNLYHLGRRHVKPEGQKLFVKQYLSRAWRQMVQDTRRGQTILAQTILQGCRAAITGHSGQRPPRRPGMVNRVIVKLLSALMTSREIVRGA